MGRLQCFQEAVRLVCILYGVFFVIVELTLLSMS